MKKRLTALLVGFSMLVLTACGGGNTAQPESVAETAESVKGTAAAEASEDKGYKESIVIGIHGAATSTDPQDKDNIYHSVVYKMSHDRLVGADPKTGEPVPELAKSWEWVSDTEIEFKLRDDVDFQNGSHFTADDVVFTFDRAKTSNGTAFRTKNLVKCEAVDEYTVRMEFTEPNPDWIDMLPLSIFSILSKDAVEADPANGASVGTGLFCIEEMVPSDHVDLVRNDNYWGETTPTKNVQFRYIAENSARLIALQNGEIDVCTQPNATDLVYIENDANLDLVEVKGASCTYFAFNTSKAPGNDPNLRMALAYAMNLDDIITVAVGGLATPAVSNWGWNTYGYYDEFGAYGQDLEKAKEYLQKSYPNGDAKLQISCTSGINATTAQIIQEQARAIGLEITINEVESAALSAMSYFDVAEHQSMIYNLGWLNYGDDARRPYYPGQNTNKAILSDERITGLIDAAAKEMDDTARMEMYKEIQEINHEQAYYIPMYYAAINVGVNKNLEGVDWASNNHHDYSYARVKKQ